MFLDSRQNKKISHTELKLNQAGHSVILATWEADIRRITFEARANSSQDPNLYKITRAKTDYKCDSGIRELGLLA
jgi:hypothetical protein